MSAPSSDAVERVRSQLGTGGRTYRVLLGITSLALVWFAFVIWTFVTEGHTVTNLGNWGTQAGVPWGLDIAAFRWWASMGVGAVLLSAAITVFEKDEYSPYARIGAFLGPFAFLMALFHVLFDLGRPDRVFITFLKRPLSSPIIWDIIILGGLATLTTGFLLFSIRGDLAELRDGDALPDVLSPVYTVALLGHNPDSDLEDRIARGIAAVILVYAPLAAGGFVPLFVGASGSSFDWFGAIQGPAFMLSSLAAGGAAVTLISVTLRYGYGWSDVFDDDTLAGLGALVAAASVGYLLTIMFKIQSGAFGPSFAGTDVGGTAASGELLPLLVIAVGLIVAGIAYLTAQRALDRVSNAVTGTAVAVLLFGILLLETWITVGGLITPELFYGAGEYNPSWTEMSNVLGTVAVVTMLYLVMVRVLPIVPLGSFETGDA